MRIITTIITLIGFIPCLWFVIRYWYVTGGKWIRDEAGQFFMSLIGTLAALFGIGLLGVWYTADWMSWAALIIFTAFILEMWWPLRLLRIAQQQKKIRNAEQQKIQREGSVLD